MGSLANIPPSPPPPPHTPSDKLSAGKCEIYERGWKFEALHLYKNVFGALEPPPSGAVGWAPHSAMAWRAADAEGMWGRSGEDVGAQSRSHTAGEFLVQNGVENAREMF